MYKVTILNIYFDEMFIVYLIILKAEIPRKSGNYLPAQARE